MAQALLHFLEAQLWCVLLVISFVGYGDIVLKCLRIDNVSAGVAACVGVAVALLLGGILNFLHLITSDILIGITLLGLFAAWGRLPVARRGDWDGLLKVWHGASRRERVALFCFGLLFLFRATSATYAMQYLPEDDENFYLAMPVKMMQTHHFAADPFSERRIESSLGGSYFLQGFVLSVLPLINVQMVDRFIGAVLIVVLVLAVARRLKTSIMDVAIAGIFSASLTPIDFNVTYSVLPSAIILAMVLTAMQREAFASQPALQAFIIGLMAGSLCVLKSTTLPFAGLFCVVLCSQMGGRPFWKGALAGWSAALAGALLIMLPWMVAMRISSGTFLYPLLGSGYDFSAYHQFPMPFRAEPLKVFEKGATFILFFIVVIFAQVFLLRRERSTVLLVTMIVGLVATVATAFATGADDSQRYNFCIVMPLLVLAYLQFTQECRLRPEWNLGPALRLIPVAVILGWIVVHAHRGQYTTMSKEVALCFTGRTLTSPETQLEYAQIRAAIPAEGLILTTLQEPYLLDPLDERILLADFPGCAGLPPGWPIKEDGEALAKYLLGNSIRYLAYTYVGNTQLRYCQTTDLKKMSMRSQIQYGSYLLANEQYLELKRTRRTIYDDGKVFILDLSTEAAPRP